MKVKVVVKHGSLTHVDYYISNLQKTKEVVKRDNYSLMFYMQNVDKDILPLDLVNEYLKK